MDHIGTTKIPEGQKYEKWSKSFLKEKLTKKSPNLSKDMDIQNQDTIRISNTIISKTSTARHITIKLPEVRQEKKKFFSWNIVDLQYYINFRCTNIMIQFFYRLYSTWSYYKTLATFFTCIIYPGCLFVLYILVYISLITCSCIDPHCFPLPTSINTLGSVSVRLFLFGYVHFFFYFLYSTFKW